MNGGGTSGREGPGPGGPDGPLGTKALISPWRGRGPRPPASSGGGSALSPSLCSPRPMLPARTARTPRLQQNYFGPPLLKDYISRVCKQKTPVIRFFEKFGSSPIYLAEKENGFISEEVLVSGGSANRGRSLK